MNLNLRNKTKWISSNSYSTLILVRIKLCLRKRPKYYCIFLKTKSCNKEVLHMENNGFKVWCKMWLLNAFQNSNNQILRCDQQKQSTTSLNAFFIKYFMAKCIHFYLVFNKCIWVSWNFIINHCTLPQ